MGVSDDNAVDEKQDDFPIFSNAFAAHQISINDRLPEEQIRSIITRQQVFQKGKKHFPSEHVEVYARLVQIVTVTILD